METHSRNIPGLAGSQQLAGTAHLQVTHRDRIASSKLRIFGYDFQSFLSFRGGQEFPVSKEIGVSARRTAPYPPTELVKLRQAEGVRPIHDECIGIWDVETR